MAYSTIQNSVYTNYLTTYGSQDVSKYDAHKRSELRNLYNSMVKLNKNSPLYLIPDAKDAAQSAVGLKEMARGLRNEIASMGGLDEGNLLNQKSGIAWTTYSHTGVPVLTSAGGVGAGRFGGFYDNTDIFTRMAEALGLKKNANAAATVSGAVAAN